MACAQSVERLVVGTVGYQSAVCQAVRPHTANVQASGRVGVFDAGENSCKRLFFYRERERGERERALRACTVYSRFTAVANASIVCHRLYDYHTERDNSEVANSFLMGQRSQARYRRQAVGKGKAGNLRKSARLVPPCATKESI